MLEHDHLDHVLIVFARLYEPLSRSAAFPLKVAAAVIVRARTAGMRTRWVPLGDSAGTQRLFHLSRQPALPEQHRGSHRNCVG